MLKHRDQVNYDYENNIFEHTLADPEYDNIITPTCNAFTTQRTLRTPFRKPNNINCYSDDFRAPSRRRSSDCPFTVYLEIYLQVLDKIV